MKMVIHVHVYNELTIDNMKRTYMYTCSYVCTFTSNHQSEKEQKNNVLFTQSFIKTCRKYVALCVFLFQTTPIPRSLTDQLIGGQFAP